MLKAVLRVHGFTGFAVQGFLSMLKAEISKLPFGSQVLAEDL